MPKMRKSSQKSSDRAHCSGDRSGCRSASLIAAPSSPCCVPGARTLRSDGPTCEPWSPQYLRVEPGRAFSPDFHLIAAQAGSNPVACFNSTYTSPVKEARVRGRRHRHRHGQQRLMSCFTAACAALDSRRPGSRHRRQQFLLGWCDCDHQGSRHGHPREPRGWHRWWAGCRALVVGVVTGILTGFVLQSSTGVSGMCRTPGEDRSAACMRCAADMHARHLRCSSCGHAAHSASPASWSLVLLMAAEVQLHRNVT